MFYLDKQELRHMFPLFILLNSLKIAKKKSKNISGIFNSFLFSFLLVKKNLNV